jgi:hypothetical protein
MSDQDAVFTFIGVFSVLLISVILGIAIGKKLTGVKSIFLAIIILFTAIIYTYWGFGNDLPIGPLHDSYKILCNLSLHFLPIGTASGILAGVLIRFNRDSVVNEHTVKLNRWRRQLARDKSCGKSQVVIAIDYITIGTIYRMNFRNNKAALCAFGKAAQLLSKEAGAHLYFLPFWQNYAECLYAAGRKQEAEHIMDQIHAATEEFFAPEEKEKAA